ncbi:uncharacterized protein CcaverHIS019_0305510 [Cutaneotrichosporon cavernicola]|uniref:Uncharacterized protein n=1 Tax=Cutaneotrichosporon cavernicola TaxID=279322 RepID=A0AA48IFG4_9TREE|nr:uncharacterized protein CcaverHIS019_0305510 [Cutaneotrichosporon cavernicola]BEI90481.1 hypothetical protein CcaverHIS019_0305510 [Cutaneotrichosporon cavernicola]
MPYPHKNTKPTPQPRTTKPRIEYVAQELALLAANASIAPTRPRPVPKFSKMSFTKVIYCGQCNMCCCEHAIQERLQH